MMSSRHWLRLAQRDPASLLALSLADWDLVVRQARRAGLLARMAIRLAEKGLLEGVPEAPRRHLENERTLAEKHRRDVRWEVRCIKEALAATGTPVILLKGAAYLMAELPPSRGRLFSDVDILVPEAAIPAVETALTHHGWMMAKVDRQDDRFYREWMHQIPPMTHRARSTTIDVHHTIVPRTVRLDLRAEKLFAAARPLAADPAIKVLAPTDMILHSATHLLNEGEFNKGLRDLGDIAALLEHFAAEPGFWPALVDRAAELDLRRPLFYALRYAAALLGAAVPPDVKDAARLAPPGPALRLLMDGLFERALRPPHQSCRDAFTGPALWLLYVRAHYIRLPPHLLVPHLVRKAYVRRFKQPEPPEQQQR